MRFAPPAVDVPTRDPSYTPERCVVGRGHPHFLAQEFARAYRAPRARSLEGWEWTSSGLAVVADAERIAEVYRVNLAGCSLALAVEIFDEAIARGKVPACRATSTS